MSLLAKLLKQKESVATSGGIPPGVSDAFYRSLRKREKNILTMIAGGVSLCVGLAGGLLYWGLGSMRGHQSSQMSSPAALVASTPAPHVPVSSTTVQQAIQVQISSGKKVAEPMRQVAVHAQNKRRSFGISRRSGTQKPQISSGVKQAAVVSAPQTAIKKDVPPMSIDKEALDSLLFAASSAENSQDYTKAFSLYKRAFEAAPDNYRIANNAASVCLAMGRYIAANEYANKALTLKPDYLSALINSGIAQDKLGDDKGALNALQRAVSLDPGSKLALLNLGLLQERSKRLSDAFATYKRLSDLGDNRGKLGVARIYERMGNRDEAIQAYLAIAHMQGGSGVKESARQRLSQLGY